MKLVLLLPVILALVFLIPVTQSFAQESLISIQTDDKNYNKGDAIVISGQVSEKIASAPITLQIFHSGNVIETVPVKVAQDGSYAHIILAEGPLWKSSGEYKVRASYGYQKAETSFTFTPQYSDNTVTYFDNTTKPSSSKCGSGTVFDSRTNACIIYHEPHQGNTILSDTGILKAEIRDLKEQNNNLQSEIRDLRNIIYKQLDVIMKTLQRLN